MPASPILPRLIVKNHTLIKSIPKILKITLLPPKSSWRMRSNHHDPICQKARVKEQRKAFQTCFLSTINPVLPPVGRVELETDMNPANGTRNRGDLLTHGPCVRFKAKSRIEIRLLFNSDLCLPIGREEWRGTKDERQISEIRGSGAIFPFFGGYLSRTRGYHPQRERESVKEKEEEWEDARDQRRIVIYSGWARSPWKM